MSRLVEMKARTRGSDAICRGASLSLGLAVLVLASGGCRAHPVSLATMIVGDLISDRDVKNRQEKLMGQSASGADTMFGERQDTFADAERQDIELIIYPGGDLMGSTLYAVELRDNRIITLVKAKRNIEGGEDVIKSAALKSKLIGKSPAACAAKLGSPLRTLRDKRTGWLARIYDVKNWTQLRGARYCVLRFDAQDRAKRINLVGVQASTRDDPAR